MFTLGAIEYVKLCNLLRANTRLHNVSLLLRIQSHATLRLGLVHATTISEYLAQALTKGRSGEESIFSRSLPATLSRRPLTTSPYTIAAR